MSASTASELSNPPLPAELPATWQWLWFGPIALIFGFGAWLQAQVHLNHDVAWITHGAGWLLEGRRFGKDIIDVNPPLIWFVSTPAALLVKLGWLTEPVAIRVYVWTLCLASLAICQRLMRPVRAAWGAGACIGLLMGAAFAMAILPAGGFAQREHLAFVLGLPYCVLLAVRVQGGAVSGPIAIACGALAGIAFGFKPWSLAVPALLELLQLARCRTFRSLWRAETLALAATLVIYLLSILLFAREYLTDVVPMVIATYWAYDGTGAPWFYWRAATAPLLVAVVFLAVARQFPAPARALTAAFLGFSFSYWAQGRGFSYHAYPALATAFTLFAYAAVPAAGAIRALNLPVRPLIKVGLAACVGLFALHCTRVWSKPVVGWYDKYEAQAGEVGALRTELIERINATVPRGGYVYAFSSHPFPAFPTMSYTAAEWGSPLAGQFALPAMLARKRVSDPARLAAIDAAVQSQREQVLKDFVLHEPAMVLIETRPDRLGMRGRNFDDVAFYNADPRFAAIWRHYVEAKPVGSLRVFMRRGQGAT
jgi:hypothetical protein